MLCKIRSLSNIYLFLGIIQAENRIVKKFPERILLLNEVLSKPEFRISEIGLKSAIDVPSLKIENHVNK